MEAISETVDESRGNRPFNPLSSSDRVEQTDEQEMRPNRRSVYFCTGPRQWCVELLRDDEEPSNETLLSTAFVTFLVFCVCQTVASFLAHSQAMLGDSAAMWVDSFTYAFNLYAERKKSSSTRKERLRLELIPPLVSVISLVGVTSYIISDALSTIIGDKDIDDPNTAVMAIFSTLNLVLDLVNMACFAKARKLLGFAVLDTGSSLDHMYDHHYHRQPAISNHTVVHQKRYSKGSGIFENEQTSLFMDESSPSYQGKGLSTNEEECENVHAALPDDDELYVGTKDDSANLNMCSAYTHVFADTCRSIAVMIAAFIAEFNENVSSKNADAYAAIAVSIFILLSLAPLLRGMVYTWTELQMCEEGDVIDIINEEVNEGEISSGEEDDVVENPIV